MQSAGHRRSEVLDSGDVVPLPNRWEPPPPPPDLPVYQPPPPRPVSHHQRAVEEGETQSLIAKQGNIPSSYKDVHDGLLRSRPTAPRKGWLHSPVVLLVFFTSCNLLNYFDRGAMGALVGTIGTDFDLSFSQRGILGGAFMFGFMVFSPLFAHFAKVYSSTKLMTIGLFIWVLAAAGAGFSVDFYSLTVARTIIGIGEASFAALAPVYIDDIAPYYRRTLWLSCFFAATPVGAAAGFILGGTIQKLWRWEYLFWGEAVAMIPFVLLCFFIPVSKDVVFKHNPEKDANPDVDEGVIKDSDFWSSLCGLVKNSCYVCTVLGYSSFIFVVGALSYWCTNYLEEQLHMDPFWAGLGVGIVTIFSGLFGTAFGGLLLDRLGGSQGKEGATRALKLAFICACVCFPTALFAFLVDPIWLFFLLVVPAEFFLFASTAPINGALLSIVSDDQRSFAMGVCIFVIHLIGDFPSPILVGAIIDFFKPYSYSDNVRIGLLFPCFWLVWAVGFLLSSWIVIRSPDYHVPTPAKLIKEKSSID
eukprot:TRINITY_DN3210_c0_g1_i2.p1 TRINITY_DN3210_c0_g1~~TRINITY_DN3210_c0_g1_i2.p1  ORF type:complete len:544 (-),score=119.94 TRINITY_DN3210_c0_g1_i2:346-1935(-)